MISIGTRLLPILLLFPVGIGATGMDVQAQVLSYVEDPTPAATPNPDGSTTVYFSPKKPDGVNEELSCPGFLSSGADIGSGRGYAAQRRRSSAQKAAG